MGERSVQDALYANNSDVPTMLGRAKVLREHYLSNKSRHAGWALTEARQRVLHYASLAAVRRIMPNTCYCAAHACGDSSVRGCASLARAFDAPEEALEVSIQRVLRVTYGTAERAEIARIRASLRVP